MPDNPDVEALTDLRRHVEATWGQAYSTDIFPAVEPHEYPNVSTDRIAASMGRFLTGAFIREIDRRIAEAKDHRAANSDGDFEHRLYLALVGPLEKHLDLDPCPAIKLANDLARDVAPLLAAIAQPADDLALLRRKAAALDFLDRDYPFLTPLDICTIINGHRFRGKVYNSALEAAEAAIAAAKEQG